MAITKIWKVTSTLDKSISYIEDEEKTRNRDTNEKPTLTNLVYYAMNPKKTEKQVFVTGINCDEKKAVDEMLDVKRAKGKTDGIQVFHAVQSFAEGEVTPQVAHEIGIKLAEEMWGDRFQVVVSTHLNTDNLHNHFIINSVSFKDGKKLYDSLEHLAILRSKSDELCTEYQLSVLKERPVPSGIDFEKFLIKYNAKNLYYKQIRSDIDNCIGKATNYTDFIKLLKEVGYEVKERANKLSIKRVDRKRNIRIERVFGSNYSISKIQERIQIEKSPVEIHKKYYHKVYVPKCRYKRNLKRSKLQKLYITKSIEYSVSKYKKRVYNREEIDKLHKVTQNTTFLLSHKIETLEDLLSFKEECNNKLEKVSNEVRKVQYMLKKKDTKENDKDFMILKLRELKIEKAYYKEEISKCDQVYMMTSAFKEEQKKELERKEKEVNEYGNRYRS